MLPTTLTMDRVRAPLLVAQRTALMVSAVSPDWLIATTRHEGSSLGSR